MTRREDVVGSIVVEFGCRKPKDSVADMVADALSMGMVGPSVRYGRLCQLPGFCRRQEGRREPGEWV
jgi:hypothetical protein